MYSKRVFKFIKNDTFVLTAYQELIGKEIAKNCNAYRNFLFFSLSPFNSDNFNGLNALNIC